VNKFFKKNYPILIVVALATILRLYKISSYLEFLGDQGRDVYIVRKFLTKFDLMFIGPQTSIGNMYLGPYYYYLMAPFLLLANFSPVGPAIMVIITSLITTYLIYFIFNKFFKHKYFGLYASLLYAISPVSIKYSNFSWNPNIMPFLSIIYFYLNYLVFYKKQYKLITWLTIVFVLALNSHYLALIFLPISLATYLLSLFIHKTTFKKELNDLFKPAITAIIIFLISLLPLIIFDIKHNGQNINAFIQFFTVRQTTINLKAYKAIPNFYPLFNQINTRLIFAKIDNWGLYLSPLFLILIIANLVIRRKSKHEYFLFVLFYFVGIIGLGLYKQHIYDHYFGFLFPILFILYSASLMILNKKTVFKIILIPLIILPIILSISQNPFRFSPPNQLQTTKEITHLIAQQAKNQPFNLALIAKNNYDPPYRYFLELDKQPLYLLSNQKTDQLFVICEPNPDIECFPEGNPLWDIAAFGIATVTNQWQINGINIYKMISSQ